MKEKIKYVYLYYKDLFPTLLFRVVSQSFLCYGIGEAQQRFNFFILNGNRAINRTRDAKTVALDPCLPKGLTRQVSVAHLKGPCTLTDNSQPLLSMTSNINYSKLRRIFKKYKEDGKKIIKLNKYPQENETTTENENGTVLFTLQGSSDAVKCEDRMQQLFDRPLCESTFTYGDCMDAQSVPPVHGLLYVSMLLTYVPCVRLQ